MAVAETEFQELGGASGTVSVALGWAVVARWRYIGPAGSVCVSVVFSPCSVRAAGASGGSLSGSFAATGFAWPRLGRSPGLLCYFSPAASPSLSRVLAAGLRRAGQRGVLARPCRIPSLGS